MRREVYIDCRVLVFFFECSTRGINKTYTRLFYTTTLSLIHCNLTPAAASFFFFFKNCSFSISLFFVNSTVVSNHETGQSCDFCTTRQRRKISGEKKEAERKSERRNAGVSASVDSVRPSVKWIQGENRDASWCCSTLSSFVDFQKY